MLPTPSTTHINPSRTYEPAEDSYLVLDTLSSTSQKTYLQTRFPTKTTTTTPTPTPLILELGTGSGVVLAFLNAHATTIFGRPDILTLGIDVSDYACQATQETVRLATATESQKSNGGVGFFTAAVRADLTSSLLDGQVDVLVFNPPYVPTESLPAAVFAEDEDGMPLSPQQSFERDSRLLELTYAGGVDGMEVTGRLLEVLPRVLSARGLAFVLLCAQNRPREVAAKVRDWTGGGWEAEIVGSSGMKAGWEKLCILRIARVVE